MYTVSHCDVFRLGELYLIEMLELARYDHFWVVGEDVTVIPELFTIQQTVPKEIRVFRDSSSHTVAGVLLNKNIHDLSLEAGEFSDSAFKGSTFMNIRTPATPDIVTVGENPSLHTTANRVLTLTSLDDLPVFVAKNIQTEYFYLIPPNFQLSPYFAFEARTTNVLDCHYSYVGQRGETLANEHGVRLLNRRLLLGEASPFLSYAGYLELEDFSGTAAP